MCKHAMTKCVVHHASMAELADAPDLGSGGEIHAGSIPVTRTNEKSPQPRGFSCFVLDKRKAGT